MPRGKPQPSARHSTAHKLAPRWPFSPRFVSNVESSHSTCSDEPSETHEKQTAHVFLRLRTVGETPPRYPPFHSSPDKVHQTLGIIKLASHFKKPVPFHPPQSSIQHNQEEEGGATRARTHAHTHTHGTPFAQHSLPVRRSERVHHQEEARCCHPTLLEQSVEVEALFAGGGEESFAEERLGGVVGQLEVVGARVHRGEGAVRGVHLAHHGEPRVEVG